MNNNMPLGWSQGVPTVSMVGSSHSSTSSEESRKHEASSMYKLLKKESCEEFKATVAVVRPESFFALDRKLQTSRWKFWKSKPGMFVTTPECLQRTIDDLEADRRFDRLNLFISRKIEEIEFHVGSSIQILSVFRCPHHPRSNNRVLIKGSSTYSSVRLDDWQFQRHRHALYLGDGVSINVDMADTTSWTESVPILSDAQKEEVYGHFLCMKEYSADGSFWKPWKRHMAIVTGLIGGVGGMTPSFDATAEGCYVEYIFGATASRPSSPGSTLVSAAGTAGLLKAGVQAPIYFISWDILFRWMRGMLPVVCGRYWSSVDRLLHLIGGKWLECPSDARPVRPSLSRAGSSRDEKHVSWTSKEPTVSHFYVGESLI
ncbi:hypothetical protein DL765_006831 [Monosporascus sp. GIB2]|nr:hypothetical protein DL765_006831 [Monosporascus sp. GIB2]